MQIKLVLCDLDGTLVDTKEANFRAYREVLKSFDYHLTAEKYDTVFGVRINEFLQQIGISNYEYIERIKQQKRRIYPQFFNYLTLNKSLLNFIAKYKESGCKTGIISTAQRHNITNVLNYFSITHHFDIVVSGNEITAAKPDPSAYLYAMDKLNYKPTETLIFEDSKTGIEAAQKAGSAYIIINHAFFKH